jgi:fluoroquinolone transport system ATP-binding protein
MSDDTRPAIEVADLRHTYPGADHPAVDGLSFSVGAGEVFGFLGPSGAGKTTTQQCVIGLLDGWTGSVRIFGRDVGAWGRELYDLIGVAFELPAGYARLTAREDLAHFAALHGSPARDIDELLASVWLADAADTAVGSFSKGMRIRLNLARAMLHNPRLLFLDEPTSGLDPATARQVRALILAERDRGTSVFLTTHDMATADVVCDRVAFMVDGRIAAVDNPRALRLAAGTNQVRVEYLGDDGRRVERLFPLNGDGNGLATLMASGRVEAIHSTEASLDDVFVQLTGRTL